MTSFAASLATSLAEIRRSRWFMGMMAVKLSAIFLLIPTIQTMWFVPFVVHAIQQPGPDPWSSYLTQGGSVSAFPYGPVMLLFHLPPVFVGWLADRFLHTDYFAGLGFRASLLAADIGILFLLVAMYRRWWREILIFYWASPLVFYITYWHGQTDIVPVLLFVASFYLIRTQRYAQGGVALACAVAAKHSMLIAAPFIFIYLWLRRGLGARFAPFLAFFVGAGILLEGPLLLSPGFWKLVLDNHEAAKLLWLSIPMGEHVDLYPTVLAYLFLLLYVWRMRRLNADLLWASMGVAFGVIILMTPASPGWFLWLAPMLAVHQSRRGGSAVLLTWLFSVGFIAYHLLNATGPAILFVSRDIDLSVWAAHLPHQINSALYTVMLALGLMTILQILRDGVRGNDYYRLGRRPLAIGIAGDSATGKTTFENLLLDLFGRRMAVSLSGDDYHNWDRASPMWKSMTHLDPRANRLSQLANDVRRILDGDAVAVGEYDHACGRFLPAARRESRNVVIVSGLHSFYPRALAEDLDVKFFLQMDDDLRLSLKMRRDVGERGHDEDKVRQAIERRRPDYERFIKPQSERAQIVFTLRAANPDLLAQAMDTRHITLHALIRNGVYVHDLVKVLVGVCGLHVNMDRQDGAGAVEIEVSGDVAPEDIDLACGILLPHMEDLIDSARGFGGGVQGVMQLIALAEIDEALKRRRRIEHAAR